MQITTQKLKQRANFKEVELRSPGEELLERERAEFGLKADVIHVVVFFFCCFFFVFFKRMANKGREIARPCFPVREKEMTMMMISLCKIMSTFQLYFIVVNF